MAKKVELNSKAMEVYDFLVKFTTEHCYPPSVREIAEGVGLKSKCSVSVYLDRLESAGMVKIDDKTARAIRIVGYKFIKED